MSIGEAIGTALGTNEALVSKVHFLLGTLTYDPFRRNHVFALILFHNLSVANHSWRQIDCQASYVGKTSPRLTCRHAFAVMARSN